MKRLFIIIAVVLLTLPIWAQSPQKMSYQAVVRDGNSILVTSHSVGMRVSILQGATPVYVETHATSTNANGLVTIEIGGGTFVSGIAFSAIDWSADTYSIKTETDPTGGTNYPAIVGTSQLLSVPFALYSKTAEGISGTITASQVSDFQSNVSNNASVLLNTAKNSYPSADQTKLAAITGTNTGDETTSTIKTKLGITTLSGSNTGDQNLESVLTQGTDAGNKKIINVNQQGIGTATPDASSALEISSTTQGFLPPRMTQTQRDLITPVAGLIIYNISTNRPNYYDGNENEWKNYDGTSEKTLEVALGDAYQGGYVVYILQIGDPGYIAGETHGLIATEGDQGYGEMQWYNGTYTTTGAIAAALGTGNANTNTIVSNQGAGEYAAKLCKDFLTDGYGDWSLPSKEELNKLYLNKAFIWFGGTYYWSSTESDNNNAWIQNVNTGAQSISNKSNTHYVKAVRRF